MDGPPLGMKSFEIKKRLVYEAWMKVQANNGAPGVDSVSIERFADNERDNSTTCSSDASDRTMAKGSSKIGASSRMAWAART
jgi:hypothetical protein